MDASARHMLHIQFNIIVSYCSVILFQTGSYTKELQLPEVGAPPYLRSASLSSLSDLGPFFATLMFLQTSAGTNTYHFSGLSSSPWLPLGKCSTVAAVEDVILQDFLESFIIWVNNFVYWHSLSLLIMFLCVITKLYLHRVMAHFAHQWNLR